MAMAQSPERDALPGSGRVPRVSVIMGTYNGEKYLRLAIESILSQTFRDFELIVIDDCSSDHTSLILGEITDDRVRVIRNEHNLGIAATLNRAIGFATGRYVAFQDHDDISLPDRLQVQARFLDGHPEIGMVGSSCRIIDDSGSVEKDISVKCDDAALRWALLWYNPFFHTTLMVRRSVLAEIGGYSCDPRYRFSEDFEMMSRVALRHAVANLPDPLGCWRKHSTSASRLNTRQQLDAAANISFRNVCEVWRRAGEQVPPDAAYIYEGMFSFQFTWPGQPPLIPQQVRSAPKHLKKLECAFSSTTPGLEKSARTRAARYWSWGRHAVGLFVRQPRGLKLHIALLSDVVELLFYTGRLLATRRM
jgi:glycosyltransferase involved in cell wall biosynthesis